MYKYNVLHKCILMYLSYSFILYLILFLCIPSNNITQQQNKKLYLNQKDSDTNITNRTVSNDIEKYIYDEEYTLNGDKRRNKCKSLYNCNIAERFRYLHKSLYLTCNEINQILQKIDKCIAKEDYGILKCNMTLDHGYWRDVYHDYYNGEHIVIKRMKNKHLNDKKKNNLRHIRESILLYHLQDNSYIVPELGHCESIDDPYVVISPYYSTNLERLIHSGYMKKYTMKQIIKLCIDVAKGVEAIHTVRGGPFIHADIVERQFLLDNTGKLRLNDFNRGRFMQYNEEGSCNYCSGVSKGKYRAPEEYKSSLLNEKIDIYSTGNIIHVIFKQGYIMNDMSSILVYKKVKNGYREKFNEHMPLEIQDLVQECWNQNPILRPNATEIVKRLEKIYEHTDENLLFL